MPHLSWSEVRERAIRFSRTWSDATSERADKQTFYNEFFDVFGIRRASVASFEANVRNLHGNTSAIDLLWRGRLLVEHKSFGEDLDAAETQAFTYIEDLTREGRFDEIPRFVLVSDFARFVLYDLEPEEQRDLPLFAGRPSSRVSFTLGEFPRVTRSFAFMLGQTRVRLDPEDPANEKAYARMCDLHDALRAGGFTGHELERLLVRVLFCLFAEDTHIFEPESFTQFIRTQTREDGSDLGAQLNRLFDWLNSPDADTALDDTDPLRGFRYVNGDLFAERLGFARCTRGMRKALLDCCDFQWAKISPAVFGSLFQGVLDDKARRQQGAHYTSERDIMKVLRSLFLDQLRADFEQLKRDRSSRRRANLEAFQQKLRSLRFLDPACGCGNFLVLGYRELRLLEMEVVRALHGAEQQVLDVRQLLKVDVDQFHGIEYSEWPARIAEVAMWLMDHQMNGLAAEAFGQGFDRLPLRSAPHIVQGNALRVNWNAVLPRAQCSYVLGNPPFIGKQYRNAEQQADMELVWSGVRGAGVLDYVTCWYRKAAEYVTVGRTPPSPEGLRKLAGGANHRITRENTSAPDGAAETGGIPAPLRGASVVSPDPVAASASGGLADRLISVGPAGPQSTAQSPRIAFVSTNSISQGEQVGILWGELFQRYHLKIHFAHRTFSWASEARGGAHVHVVILGFGASDHSGKRIFDYETPTSEPTEISTGNISPYLVEGSDIVVTKRSHPLGAVPELVFGSMPNDGGHLMLDDAERAALLAAEPQAAPYIRPLLGSEEFINGIPRWCLWLKAAPPGALRAMPKVMSRVDGVRAHRSASNRATTRGLATTPSLFGEDRQPAHRYLLVPGVSSEQRQYIPMDFCEPDIIANNLVYCLEGADAWIFGVLTSAMHMSWMRSVAGRLESRYRYSAKLVYNNFPWPNPTPAQRARVEEKARAVLAAREPHLPPRGPATLADLYDPNTMPRDLLRAHTELDRAVEKCYRAEPFHSDRERVEHLFSLYEKLTAPLLPATPRTRGRRSKA